ncbi:DUF3087 family protein [Shewanella intestini]|uniref:DUF3087 family protein n=1 Tax=Shewanella intestini TaxID=2017544 RepID=A0ABS5I2Y8_9GAMM|nr:MULTISPECIES: DUF3087 family protein [Shewanella]MBR9728398.1 DUF3087 family protein [Shewanella intestini]MRG36740.1 DUF3087 family protein [Shewanella sp. XMDDZSB0408]
MKLEVINKAQYRKMNNRVQMALIAMLAGLSVLIGQVLIAFYGSQAMPDGSTGNFNLNFLGVIIALMICTFIVRKNREKPQFHEVYYVWQLKQLQNKIFKKLTKIKQAANDNQTDALIISLFYYQSLANVYELDNNTLTMEKVTAELEQIEAQIQQLNLTVSTDDFEQSMLAQY